MYRSLKKKKEGTIDTYIVPSIVSPCDSIDKYQNQAVIVIFLDVSVDKIRATRRLVNDFRECTEEKSAKKRG